MSEEPLFVGASWTGESWVAVSFAGRDFDGCGVFDEFGELWLASGDRAARLLIDVPIGLCETEASRRCDELARSTLGSLADAIPDPPVREATRKRRYQAADRVHERKTGTTLSEAAFELTDAIVAVEDLFEEVSTARDAVAESHPELCFRAFAGEPLDHPRGVAAGYAERMRTLAEFDPDAPPTIQSAAEATGGADVAVEDLLDAAALAYAARPGSGELRSLPADPSTDLPADPPTDGDVVPPKLLYRSDSAL